MRDRALTALGFAALGAALAIAVPGATLALIRRAARRG